MTITGKKGVAQFILPVVGALLLLIAFGPLAWKIAKISLFTDFGGGSPLTLFIIGFFLLVIIMRKT